MNVTELSHRAAQTELSWGTVLNSQVEAAPPEPSLVLPSATVSVPFPKQIQRTAADQASKGNTEGRSNFEALRVLSPTTQLRREQRTYAARTRFWETAIFLLFWFCAVFTFVTGLLPWR